jgi:hypothetical protein
MILTVPLEREYPGMIENEITVEDLNALKTDPRSKKTTDKKPKYNNRKQQIDGYVFDSRAEAHRYNDLKLLAWNKVIEGLQIHPVFVLQDKFKHRDKWIRAITYEADFAYYENGVHVVEDVKGVKTKEFSIKEKLFKARYPEIDFRLVRLRQNDAIINSACSPVHRKRLSKK